MGISMVLTTRTGERLRVSEVPYVAGSGEFATGDTLLGGVDPVGTTQFNSVQMSILIGQIEPLLASATGPRRAALEELLDMCREGRRKHHQKLCFWGD